MASSIIYSTGIYNVWGQKYERQVDCIVTGSEIILLNDYRSTCTRWNIIVQLTGSMSIAAGLYPKTGVVCLILDFLSAEKFFTTRRLLKLARRKPPNIDS